MEAKFEIDWNQVQAMAPFIIMGVIFAIVMLGFLLEAMFALFAGLMQMFGLVLISIFTVIGELGSVGMRIAKKADRNVLHAAAGLTLLALIVLLAVWLR